MKLVILDCDDVIMDTKQAVVRAMRKALDTCNIHWKWSDDAAYHMRGLARFQDPAQAFRAFIAISVGYANLDDIMQQDNPEEEIQLVIDPFLTSNYEGMADGITEEYRKIYFTAENLALEKPFAFSREAVEALSKKFKLAMVTNSRKERLMNHLKEAGIAGKFLAIVTAEDAAKKPSPEGILKVCGELGVDVSEALMMGDTCNDIAAAKAAGCKSASVISGRGLRKDLERMAPDFIFKDLMEAAQKL